jgi:hypothetical protein
MKNVCFIEMEGVLSSLGEYVANKEKVNSFLKELVSFSKKNKIELFLVSGHHEKIAKPILHKNEFTNFFDEKHFLCVDESYINKKESTDKELHENNLKKDPNFLDNYFKQVVIQQILKEKDLNERDALLLGDDIWTDGYYTTRFSKIDFAIFEDNVNDRGKRVDRINGLTYFNLDFSSVKQLLESFPKVDYSALDKYVFEVMKKVLVGDSVQESIKKAALKRLNQNN